VGEDTPRLICKKCLQDIKKGKIKIEVEPAKLVVEKEKSVKAPTVQRHAKGPRVKESLMRKIFTGGKQLPVSNNIDIDVLTPVLLFGIIGGVLTGIPLLSLLFIITIPLMSLLTIIYLRAEEDFKVFIGGKKGAVSGALMGLVAAVVSLVLIISLEAMFAAPIYRFLINTLSFLDEDTLNVIISLSGADQVLRFDVILIRAGLTFPLFPLLGGLFGAAFAKGLR